MGITIIQKSDVSVRKRNPKVALVLAGGAVTGGAFKLGGLKALDDFLINRKTTDFDIYVGLSAGALLAAPLVAGVSPSEMLRALEGRSEQFARFKPSDFYYPNFEEMASKPWDFMADLATYFPGLIADVAGKIGPALSALRKGPSLATLQEALSPLADALLIDAEAGNFDESQSDAVPQPY